MWDLVLQWEPSEGRGCVLNADVLHFEFQAVLIHILIMLLTLCWMAGGNLHNQFRWFPFECIWLSWGLWYVGLQKHAISAFTFSLSLKFLWLTVCIACTETPFSVKPVCFSKNCGQTQRIYLANLKGAPPWDFWTHLFMPEGAVFFLLTAPCWRLISVLVFMQLWFTWKGLFIAWDDIFEVNILSVTNN